jgi:hypothetical protein
MGGLSSGGYDAYASRGERAVGRGCIPLGSTSLQCSGSTHNRSIRFVALRSVALPVRWSPVRWDACELRMRVPRLLVVNLERQRIRCPEAVVDLKTTYPAWTCVPPQCSPSSISDCSGPSVSHGGPNQTHHRLRRWPPTSLAMRELAVPRA